MIRLEVSGILRVPKTNSQKAVLLTNVGWAPLSNMNRIKLKKPGGGWAVYLRSPTILEQIRGHKLEVDGARIFTCT